MPVLALALMAMGLVHRLPVAISDDLAAFVLAGGGMGDICGMAEDGSVPAIDDCPVCHLVGAVMPRGAGATARPAALVLLASVDAPRESRVVRPVLDPARGLRAPPGAAVQPV